MTNNIIPGPFPIINNRHLLWKHQHRVNDADDLHHKRSNQRYRGEWFPVSSVGVFVVLILERQPDVGVFGQLPKPERGGEESMINYQLGNPVL